MLLPKPRSISTNLVLEHQATLAQLSQQKADIQAKQVENQQAQAHLPTQFAQNHEQLAVELSRLNSESFEIESQKAIGSQPVNPEKSHIFTRNS